MTLPVGLLLLGVENFEKSTQSALNAVSNVFEILVDIPMEHDPGIAIDGLEQVGSLLGGSVVPDVFDGHLGFLLVCGVVLYGYII